MPIGIGIALVALTRDLGSAIVIFGIFMLPALSCQRADEMVLGRG